MRRGSRAGGRAIFRVEHLPYFIDAIAIQPNLHKRPYDDAYHLPEKAASLDADHKLRTACVQLTNVNGSDGTLSTMPGTRERREIVLADEHAGRVAHRLGIESLPAMPCKVGKKDWPIRRIP